MFGRTARIGKPESGIRTRQTQKHEAETLGETKSPKGSLTGSLLNPTVKHDALFAMYFNAHLPTEFPESLVWRHVTPCRDRAHPVFCLKPH